MEGSRTAVHRNCVGRSDDLSEPLLELVDFRAGSYPSRPERIHDLSDVLLEQVGSAEHKKLRANRRASFDCELLSAGCP